jgi:hypothetical protein
MSIHKQAAEQFTVIASARALEQGHDEVGPQTAQIHATLYLAEQQRVANLIAVAQLMSTDGGLAAHGIERSIILEVLAHTIEQSLTAEIFASLNPATDTAERRQS